MLKTVWVALQMQNRVFRQGLSESLTALWRALKKVAILALLSSTAQGQESIQISAIGDVLVHEALYRYATQKPDGFYSLFKRVQPFVSSADFAIANLEGPTAPGVVANGSSVADPGFVYDAQVYTGTNFVFNFHPSLIEDLKKLGIDLVSTANNHALDRRQLGIDRSLQELAQRNMLFTGTRPSQNQQDWDFTVAMIKGFRVGFLSCTEHTNGIPDKARQVLNCFADKSTIVRLVQNHSARGLDGVILLPHWGEEYKLQANRKQMKWAQEMAEAGATAIVGNHPHVLQQMEWIQNSRGQNMFVAYSLGNFVAWQAGTEKKTSAILHLLLTSEIKQGVRSLTVTQAGWTPLFRNSYSVEVARPNLGQENLQLIEKIWGSQNPMTLTP